MIAENGTFKNRTLRIIMDGYNVMQGSGLLDGVHRRSVTLKQARGEFIEILSGIQKITGRIIVIFDSKNTRAGSRRRQRNGVRIIFPYREEADGFIRRIADSKSVVITDDKELRRSLQENKVVVFSVETMYLMFFLFLGDSGNLINSNQ